MDSKKSLKKQVNFSLNNSEQGNQNILCSKVRAHYWKNAQSDGDDAITNIRATCFSLEVEVNLDMRIANERRELQECTSLLHGKITIDNS